MNPPAGGGKAPSRFIQGRGRGRGGNSYRPYFYFRRNGRVIPAGGQQQQEQQDADAAGPSTAVVKQPKATGWNRKRASKAAPIDCSFLRPEHYVAPEDALQVQSILVDNPSSCPGWRLYFLRDEYAPGSELVQRIAALKAHYERNPQAYDIEKVRETSCFKITANIIVNDEQLRAVWPNLAEDLRQRPLRSLSTLALGMHSLVAISGPELSLAVSTNELYMPRTKRTRKIYVRPVDFAPVELISNINSHKRLDTLVAMRGIVSSVGEPTFAFNWHAYRCTRCQVEQSLRQRGGQQLARPYHCKGAKCAAKEDFLALRNSPYTRLAVRQIIRIEESSLSLLTDYDSTLPGSLDIELCQELVDTVQLGQEIVVSGVLRLHGLSENGGGDLQTYLRAVALRPARQVKREFSGRDLDAIGAINAEPETFKLLVQSLAPELHGHELAKAACLLSLLGGAGSQLQRDDQGAINVLLVGDPGIGKSKLLQSCAQLTERGAHISGKRGTQAASKLGPSFVGRSKRMEAGALLAARHFGHCTVDDVDKLASKQRLLLQCMQSEELNLPLAGSFAALAAQPSIIACANPQRGQYDQARYLLQNIRILPALLKEFHLVYVLLDRPTNVARDVSLTEHVRALHRGAKKRAHIAARYALKPKTGDSICDGTFYDAERDAADSIMQQDYDLDKHLALTETEVAELDLLPPILMKKFIAYARENVQPLLNEKAMESIKKYFLELRQSSETEHQHSQIGVRQLLGLIHLSQARARLDLSSIVMPAHVRDVISVLTESMSQTSLGAGASNAAAGGSSSSSSKSSQLRSFVRMMQLRSAALGRRIFEFEELKEMGTRAGIMTGITNLVEIANLGGYLLKKGANMYEVVPE